jgi:dimethylhistidine N-methyltransferase
MNPPASLRREAPAQTECGFLADLVAGLSAHPRRLSPKYFYDAKGSALFEEITQLPEYYPTRTEIGILEAHARDLARFVPDGAALVEFGSGSSAKVRILLREMPQLAAYVPVDISGEFLGEAAEALRAEAPGLVIAPVAADFTQNFDLPDVCAGRPLVGFFPGSTIGNFEPREAAGFLRNARRVLGEGARMVVGVDLVKDARVLHAAYNDSAGVTAAFNLNMLAHANAALGADFDLDGFRHKAFFNAPLARIEMHLVSQRAQAVHVGGRTFRFAAGETIHTECSHKYTRDSFAALAAQAGWRVEATFADAQDWFLVAVLG